MREIVDPKLMRRIDIIDWIRSILMALMAALFLTQVLVVNAQVPTRSMESTINVGDRVIGNRLSYQFYKPQRGDIVIFRFPDDENQFYIKRIIGLPGEQVTIQGGEVYINDSPVPIDSSYVKGELQGNYGPYEVPEGSYFVLGDNRMQSWDSRFWDNTYVAEEKILGKALFRIVPDPKWLANA